MQQRQMTEQEYYEYMQQQQMYKQQQVPITKKKKNGNLKHIFSNKVAIGLVIILQIIIIVLIVNPSSLLKQYQNDQVVSAVSKKTDTSAETEEPVVAKVVDANQLREANAAQAQVYKDAQNGDYVVGYSDRIIIYRKGEDKIIYDGDTPSGLVTKTQQKLVDDITAKAKEELLISNSSTETPQVSLITDISTLQKTNPDFYNAARNNDIVALFPEAQVIVIYSQETGNILNSGKYTTDISDL